MTVSSIYYKPFYPDSHGKLKEYIFRTFAITVDSFIHSFISAISIAPLQVLYFSEALPTTRAWVEPTTLRLKVMVATKAPPRPVNLLLIVEFAGHFARVFPSQT